MPTYNFGVKLLQFSILFICTTEAVVGHNVANIAPLQRNPDFERDSNVQDGTDDQRKAICGDRWAVDAMKNVNHEVLDVVKVHQRRLGY